MNNNNNSSSNSNSSNSNNSNNSNSNNNSHQNSIDGSNNNNNTLPVFSAPSLPAPLSPKPAWNLNLYSPGLQELLTEIMPSADPLDAPTFNPVDYINNMFPNEQSLVDIDMAIAKVQTKIHRIDMDIKKEVQSHTKSNSIGKQNLQNSNKLIQDLFGKITEIKAKATQSERLVIDICSDIKVLDCAKKNITMTIKSMKRVHMLTTALEQLRIMVQKKQYQETAHLIAAVDELSAGLAEFHGYPFLTATNETVLRIKNDMLDHIILEFRRFEGSKGPAPRPNKDMCAVLDAMGDKYKNAFFKWFLDEHFADYKLAFSGQDEFSKLDAVNHRYHWLERDLKFIEDSYKGLFPLEWRIPELVAEEFCIITKLNLGEIIEKEKNTMNVLVFMKALKKTLEFEVKLTSKFAFHKNSIYGEGEQDSEKEGENTTVEEAEEDYSVPNAYSPDAIRKKWEKYAALKEKQKKEQEEAEKAKLHANLYRSQKFNGMISSCFNGYMDIYVEQENQVLNDLFTKLTSEETWNVPAVEHINNKVLASCTDLIYSFVEARKRCLALTKAQPFFDVCMLFKKYIGKYAEFLNGKLQILDKNRKPLTDDDEQAVCLIINTAEFSRTTITDMCKLLQRNIDERFKDKIEMPAESDEFFNAIAKGLVMLVTSTVAKVEPALHSMSKERWDVLEAFGDQSSYVSQIGTILTGCVPLYRSWMKDTYFFEFCQQFVASFVPRLLTGIEKCKKISEIGAQHLLLDVTSIKSILLSLPHVGDPVTAISPVSSPVSASEPTPRNSRANMYLKLVNTHIGRADLLLKLLISPAESLTDSFKALMPDGQETDLEKILDQKGIRGSEKNDILRRFSNRSPHPHTTPRTISSLFHPLVLSDNQTQQNSQQTQQPQQQQTQQQQTQQPTQQQQQNQQSPPSSQQQQPTQQQQQPTQQQQPPQQQHVTPPLQSRPSIKKLVGNFTESFKSSTSLN